MTEQERHIMEHATAWRHRHRLYRNHFATSPGTDDWAPIQALCERGLMRVLVSAEDGDFGGMTIFTVTDSGIAALKAADAPAQTK